LSLVRRYASKLGTAALLVCAVALSLAAAEVAVRHLRPQFIMGPDPIRNPFWRHDKELGWSHTAGSEGTFSREEFTHPVKINSAGWRDRERTTRKPPRTFRIAVLGDSFTWGHGVGDEMVFTRVMEKSLEGVEVLNFGLSASATDQQLLILRGQVLEYSPDLVLVMLTRNDFNGIMQTSEGSYPKPIYLMGEDGRLELTNVPVPEVSRLARAHYGLRRKSALVNLAESTWEAGREIDSRAVAGRREAAYRLICALLMRMRDASERSGARFAIGLVPSNAHTYFDPIPAAEVRRFQVIKDFGQEDGVAVLDLVPAFRQAARDPVTGSRIDLHYRQDQHWNEAGHRLAAQELVRLIDLAGLLVLRS